MKCIISPPYIAPYKAAGFQSPAWSAFCEQLEQALEDSQFLYVLVLPFAHLPNPCLGSSKQLCDSDGPWVSGQAWIAGHFHQVTLKTVDLVYYQNW